MGGILGIVARLLMTGNICVIRLITLAGVFPFILLPLQAAGAGSLWRSISAINCHVSLPLGCSITKGGLYQVLHLLQPEGRRALILIVTMPAGPFSQGVSWRGMDFQLHCLRPREVPYHSGSWIWRVFFIQGKVLGPLSGVCLFPVSSPSSSFVSWSCLFLFAGALSASPRDSLGQKNNIEIFVGNQAIIAITNNPIFHWMMMHFNIQQLLQDDRIEAICV